MSTKTTARNLFAIVRYDNFAAMKSAEYAYWQGQPNWARMAAVSELSLSAFRLKDQSVDVRRLQRSLVHLERE